MEKKCQIISIDSKKFENSDQFWNHVGIILRELTLIGYEVAFRYDDVGVYIIEFNYSRNHGFGNAIVEWIEPYKI